MTKKIFCIVAIISILLSIKSKVFADSIDYIHYNDLIFEVSENLNSHYLVCLISQDGSGNYHLEYKITEQPVTILYQTNFGYHIRFNSAMRNGNSSNTRNPNINFFNNTTMQLSNLGTGESDLGATNFTTDVQIFSNYDIKNANNEVIIPGFVNFSYPFFDNVTEIENGNPDGVLITPGDISRNDYIYFHLLEIQTGISNQDNSRYYYADKIFALNKDSDYFSTFIDTDKFYYYIPRYKLGLSQNSSYLYVLNDSKTQIQNSNGLIAIDKQNGTYDVVESDTTGVITATEEETERMKNIESTITQNQETVNNINDSLTNTTVSGDTDTDIDNNLNFNNNAPEFSSLFNGFFSRLTSTISDLGNYQDTDVITVSLPIPFTNNTIPISSDFIFSNQNNNFLKNIATLLWYFIFGRYFLYFLINTYWLITNGEFFENYLTQKEAITGDML